MSSGVFIGGGPAVILFAVTNHAAYFGFPGAGLAIGLNLGAAVEESRRSSDKEE